VLAAVAAACAADPRAAGQTPPVDTTRARPRAAATRADTSSLPDSIRRPQQPLQTRPAVVRGLYVNRWAAIGPRFWALVDLAKATEVNALVIDVKDDRGLVLYRSNVAVAREIGADTLQPMSYKRMRAVLDTLRTYGIFPIARIVVAKDPLLAQAKQEWAIKQRKDSSAAWLDKNGRPWLDAHQRGVWQYAVDLAKEAVNLGFSEVQLDYVRFPDEQRLVREAVFPLARGRTRAQVIREQLGFVRASLESTGAPLAIDVFGLTTTDTTDMGIGQRWEMFVDRADVVLPMTYPSHYAPGTYKLGNPNAHPYEVIDHAIKDAYARSREIPGAGVLVPWYQDFTLGPPRYGAAQVRAQIKAGYDNGVLSWVLWNPGSRYTRDALRDSLSADDLRRSAQIVDSLRSARRADSLRADSARRAAPRVADTAAKKTP
jgi:hypothetical protein